MTTPTMTTLTGRNADWRAASACLHADPDLFFPISATGPAIKQIAQAKEICAGCAVRGKCLEFARAQDSLQGIWGGTTPEERLRTRRREQRAARTRARTAA
jgi:WhiB family transcriptional regulator, redox-sensing transcriptional regulator